MTGRLMYALAIVLAFVPGPSDGARAETSRSAPAAAPTRPAAEATADAGQRDQGVLEVTADRDLEWLQQDHAYVARGNAIAKRGSVTLMGDTIVAFYRPLASAPGSTPKPAPSAKPGAAPKTGFDTGATEIWRVVVEGHVHILSQDRDAWGDRAEYDKDKAVVVLTGQNLKATSLTEIITARDTLEYWDQLDMAVARGDAKIVKVDGDTLVADVIAGHFLKNAQNQTFLKTLDGRGNVVLTTQSDIVHGDQGTYDLEAKRTVMFGNVRATRGESQLEGESAEVNMVTGISQVFPGAGQRVQGVFVRPQPLIPKPIADKKKQGPR
jgi:lipopolysaccharide export system protein LptA